MISVIGLGFVGGSMKKSFELKGEHVKGYDKFKQNKKYIITINYPPKKH